MADLVQITFPSEEKAEQVRQKLLDLQKEYLIELSDAVIAVKQPDGHVKLNQLFHPTAASAVSGTFWGALIGMIFLMPLAGAAIGAASGALGGALSDVGIEVHIDEIPNELPDPIRFSEDRCMPHMMPNMRNASGGCSCRPIACSRHSARALSASAAPSTFSGAASISR